MKHFRIFTTAVLASGLAAVAFAATHTLSGEYYIGGKTMVDPSENEKKDTHFRIFLNGASARDLYLAMKVRPVKDECLLDGSTTKFIGGTACTKHVNGKFECSFSVNIKAQRVESAYAC